MKSHHQQAAKQSPIANRPGFGQVIQEILAASRPVSWINTAAPFAAAYLLRGGGLDSIFWIGLIYFTLPYNLLVYGVNDIYDYASDLKNPRKGGIEGSIVNPSRRKPLWIAIIFSNLIFGWLIWPLISVAGQITAVVLVGLALSYSIKGLRFKEVPVLDSINSSLHFVGPAIFGCIISPTHMLAWLALTAFFCWGVASHAIGAIQDIQPDREADIKSIATQWGARRTIRFVVVMYCLSVFLTIFVALPSSLVAASLLLAFPLNAAFFLKYTSDAQSALFRRAWTNFMWLNIIVGFWLTQLILWVNDPMKLGDARIDVLLIVFTLISISQLALLTYNLASFRRPKSPRLEEWPRMSILIHAFNQADNIASTLLAALGQDYPDFEIIFTDLDSEDNTLKIAQTYDDKRFKIVKIDPIKPGWGVQAWAADQLLKKARGDYAVILSADTVLLPTALAQIATLMESQKLHLLSLLPADQNKSIAQKTILSHNQYLLLAAYPAAYLQNHAPDRSTAHGGILALAIDKVREHGGFSRVKASPLEHQELFHHARRYGLKAGLYRASDFATSQNHQDLRSILDDDIQLLYPALRFHFPIAWGLFIGGLVLFTGPLFILIMDIISGLEAHLMLAAIALVAQLVTRLVVAWDSKQNYLAQFFAPITNVLIMILLIYSALHYELFKPRWQNRTEIV
ncbi:MAG: prenyltransferase [bacterium]